MSRVLAPQVVLAAGVLAALSLGMFHHFSRALMRLLGIAVLLAALTLTIFSSRGGDTVLMHVDALSLAWQCLFYVGALPLALTVSGDEEITTALLLGSVLGMGLLAAASNLPMMFIGLEFMSLPAYLLVARGQSVSPARRLEAAVKYFFAGGMAGSLFLLGMVLRYSVTGNFALTRVSGPIAELSVALMGAAALFKIGAVPLHFWLPDVYEACDPQVAGFLSTAMKAAAVLFLMRLTGLSPHGSFARALPWLGALTSLYGALTALRQTSLQRLLAYSSIAHAGYLILGIGAWAAQDQSPVAAAALFFYLTVYLVMSNGAFAFLRVSGLKTREDLKGYGAARPALAGLFALLLLALGGIPPTGGFLGKFLVLWEAIKAGLYGPVAVGAIAALTALGYYLGLIRDMYFDTETATAPSPAQGASLIWLCALGALLLGVAPHLVDLAAGVLAR